jgi:hypothetical protein
MKDVRSCKSEKRKDKRALERVKGEVCGRVGNGADERECRGYESERGR